MIKQSIIAGLLGWVALAAVGQDNVTADRLERLPKIALGEEPRPMQAPRSNQQVMVLSIDLQYQDGKVTDARVRSVEQVNSVAPKVFARKGGDWKVTIHGSEDHSFFVFNPGYLEAETARGSRNPYTYVSADGDVRWSLVIPLYRDGEMLNATAISVTDNRTEQEILRTEMR